MRTVEKIAAEAIMSTCGKITDKTVNYAIDIARTEAISEIMLRNTTNANHTRVYVLSGSSWSDIVRYIRAVEYQGDAVCTNTAWNRWREEIDCCDIVLLLEGWNNTKLGRAKGMYATMRGKGVLHWMNSKYRNTNYKDY